MAFATGSQIRPELSAVNYTPYLQATGQAAQMIARGGENIGAALANLGQQAASGLDKYYKKQEEKKLNEQAASTVGYILKNNPAFGEQLNIKQDASGEYDPKALQVIVKSFGGAPNTIQIANTLSELTRKKSEETQTAQEFNALVKSGGKNGLPETVESSPRAKMIAQAEYAKLLESQSQVIKNTALKPENLSFEEQQLSARKKDFFLNKGRAPTPAEEVKMMEDVKSSGLPPVGESEFSKISAQNLANRAEAALNDGAKAMISLENMANVKSAIASGSEQGTFADIKIGLMNAANTFLSKENQFDTTQSSIASLGWNEITLATAEKIQKQGSITNSEREQAKNTSGRITTPKEAALFYISFKEANDKRRALIADSVSKLKEAGDEDRAKYAYALNIKNYPSLDDPIYGDYGVKINAINAAAELAKRSKAKGAK
jgi:hypothetical protein